MSFIEDTRDALSDGDTSDVRFWVALALFVLIIATMVSVVCGWFACRRCRRRRAFEKELNGRVQVEELWEGDGTAPLQDGSQVNPPHTLPHQACSDLPGVVRACMGVYALGADASRVGRRAPGLPHSAVPSGALPLPLPPSCPRHDAIFAH